GSWVLSWLGGVPSSLVRRAAARPAPGVGRRELPKAPAESRTAPGSLEWEAGAVGGGLMRGPGCSVLPAVEERARVVAERRAEPVLVGAPVVLDPEGVLLGVRGVALGGGEDRREDAHLDRRGVTADDLEERLLRRAR